MSWFERSTIHTPLIFVIAPVLIRKKEKTVDVYNICNIGVILVREVVFKHLTWLLTPTLCAVWTCRKPVVGINVEALASP